MELMKNFCETPFFRQRHIIFILANRHIRNFDADLQLHIWSSYTLLCYVAYCRNRMGIALEFFNFFFFFSVDSIFHSSDIMVSISKSHNIDTIFL